LVTLISVGIAFGITQISVGLANKQALKASLTMSALTLLFYFPVNAIFKQSMNGFILFAMLLFTIALAVGVGIAFSKIDRGPIVRTTVITAVLSAFSYWSTS
jgi:peptide/nickel transport system permease protein